ncbi:MAG: hypothetical protein JNJ54_33775 [Myxococcaceae bacterium]|nr:hypothetical protein [Myxococcaceae bacterium]
MASTERSGIAATWLLRLVAQAAIVGCQCFQPVDECALTTCDAGSAGGAAGGRVIGGGSGGGSGGSAGGASGGSTTGGGSGGGVSTRDAGTCPVWDGGGVGLCAAITGYVFRGTDCWGECVLKPITTPGVFEDLASCVQCGCDTSKFANVPPLGTPLHPGSFCDEVLAVTSIPRLLETAFPGYDIDAGCRPGAGFDSHCVLLRGSVDEAGYARACAATLVPRVSQVRCVVFLP